MTDDGIVGLSVTIVCLMLLSALFASVTKK